MCLYISFNTEVTASDKRFNRTLRNSCYKSSFTGMFKKFKGPANVSKLMLDRQSEACFPDSLCEFAGD